MVAVITLIWNVQVQQPLPALDSGGRSWCLLMNFLGEDAIHLLLGQQGQVLAPAHRFLSGGSYPYPSATARTGPGDCR